MRTNTITRLHVGNINHEMLARDGLVDNDVLPSYEKFSLIS